MAAETSRDKGKGIDPRNWGALALEEEEVQPDVQRALLNEFGARRDLEAMQEQNAEYEEPEASEGDQSQGEGDNIPLPEDDEAPPVSRKELLEYLAYKRKLERELHRRAQKEKSAPRKRRSRAASEPLSGDIASLIEKVADVDTRNRKAKEAARKASEQASASKPSAKYQDHLPINQIGVKSSLGKAFRRVQSEVSDSSYESPSDSSSSSSGDASSSDSESSSDSSDSGSSTSTSSSGLPRGSRRGSRRNHKRRSRKNKHKSRRSMIKPTPPEKYNGRADWLTFQRFMTHGLNYVKYGYVEKPRQVIVLSEFLVGKAYTFFTRNVALKPHKWDLQRARLDTFVQGRLSVKEYVSELNELFSIVGTDGKRARVVKLFNGFKPSIQRALYRVHMNAEQTSWKKMVQEAEYQELAEN
ncbi:hypothetical protein H0H81_005823, partial [Sphagnurus paluster]